MNDEPIYVYAQHCVQSSKVALPEEVERKTTAENGVSPDLEIYAAGETAAIRRAREDLLLCTVSEGPSYRWRCAHNVLEYFGE